MNVAMCVANFVAQVCNLPYRRFAIGSAFARRLVWRNLRYHRSADRIRSGSFESQRDFVIQPRVASPRATLGQARKKYKTLKGFHQNFCYSKEDATPLGLNLIFRHQPRVAALRQPWAERCNPFGIVGSDGH